MKANNMKAIREALERCWFIALQWKVDETDSETGTINNPNARRAAETVLKMESLMFAALTEHPPRNCDVGTEQEQHRRFIDYCNACDCPMGCIHRKEFVGMLDERCASMLKCYIRWSQMPYKKGEADGSK